MTIGEQRVRLDFNPSGNELVFKIKRLSADLIDVCADHKNEDTSTAEKARHWSLAMTSYEEACQWAVKAATSE